MKFTEKIINGLDQAAELFLSGLSVVFVPGWVTIKGMITSPAFLLLSASTVGVVQVFTYRTDITGRLIVAAFICFGLMTVFGLAKHVATGEANGKVFMVKTIIQFVVTSGVIMLGYVASMLVEVVLMIASEIIPAAKSVPGLSLYFIFTGYAISITYHFIKSCDLIDQLLPKFLPSWFSAPFRRYRETGNYKDLIAFADEEKEEAK